MVSFPQVLKSVACLLDRCPARAHNKVRLREIFIYRYWKAKIDILKEVSEPLPQWDHWGMNMPTAQLWRHKRTFRCDRYMEMLL